MRLQQDGLNKAKPIFAWHRCKYRRNHHCRRATDERNELAPLHSITSSARAISEGGTSRPSALAVRRLMTNERDTTLWTRDRACWCGCVASVPPRGCSSSLSSVRDRLIDQRVDHLPVMPSDRPR